MARARNAADERPVDIARHRGHGHLLDVLEPPVQVRMPPESETLRRIQIYFHAVIRARAQHLVDEHALRLPELEVMLELDEPRMWFPVPGTYGGFSFWFEPAGPNTRLVSESWCRVVEGSEERHEVTASGVTQGKVDMPGVIILSGPLTCDGAAADLLLSARPVAITPK